MLGLWQNFPIPTILMIFLKANCLFPKGRLHQKALILKEPPNNADDQQKGELSFPEGPLARKCSDFDRTAQQCWQSAKRRLFFFRSAACTKMLRFWKNCPTMLMICKNANCLFPKGRLHENALTLTELPNNADNLQKGECSFPEGPLARKCFDFVRTAQQCWWSAKGWMLLSRRAACTKILRLWQNCPTILMICKKANVLFLKGPLHENSLTLLTELPNNTDDL